MSKYIQWRDHSDRIGVRQLAMDGRLAVEPRFSLILFICGHLAWSKLCAMLVGHIAKLARNESCGEKLFRLEYRHHRHGVDQR